MRIYSLIKFNKKFFPKITMLISYKEKYISEILNAKVYNFKHLKIHKIYNDQNNDLKVFHFPFFNDSIYVKKIKKIIPINGILPVVITHIQEFENLKDTELFFEITN